MWCYVMLVFVEDGYWVVVVDYCGVGEFDKLFGGYDKVLMVGDICVFVYQFGVMCIYFVGCDIGVMVVYVYVV